MENHRRILLFLVILFILNACRSQNYFTSKNDFSEYKYEYAFSFENEGTTSVNTEERKAKKSKISGVISSEGETLPFCNIQLTRTDYYPKRKLETDSDGKFEEEIPAGKYKAQVYSSFMTESLTFDFEVKENTELIFDIYLKSTQLPTIYQINSKEPLTKKEIREIMNCIRERKGKSCAEENKYHISIQI